MKPSSAGRTSRTLEKATHLILAMIVSFSGGLHAAELDLSRVPLLVNAGIPPNILVSLDDSGSMGWGYMPDTANYGVADCRRYDSNFNTIYYNPALTYNPPLHENGVSFPNASFTNAWWDGYTPTVGSSNLSNSYRVSTDHQGCAGTYNCGWSLPTVTTAWPPGTISTIPLTRRAFYCTGNTVHIIGSDAAQRQNFANWFSYYRTRSLVARTAMSTAFARMDPKNRVARQNFNSNNIVTSTEIRPIAEGSAWRTNFFDWLHVPRFSGGTPMRASTIRAGDFFSRSGTNHRSPYWDEENGRELSCRQNFHLLVTDGYWNENNPSWSHGNYDRTNIGFPDTTAYAVGGAASAIYSNEVTGGAHCTAPSGASAACVPTLSDIAMYYWARDLRPGPGMPNNVPSYYGDMSTGKIASATAEQEVYFNPANDPGNWQRMVNFIVGFGVSGTLAYNDQTGVPMTKDQRLLRLRQGLDAWPQMRNYHATTIDDSWHAAINSRGDYLSANDPQELINALAAVLDNVTQRQGVTGSSGSSAFQRSGSMVFESSYDSSDWSGDIAAMMLNEDGSPGAPAWAAGTAAHQLDGRSASSRTILTWRPGGGATPNSGAGVNFRWSELNADQRTALNRNPNTGIADGEGEERLEYLRGERSLEQSVGGPYRNRGSTMGAFLDSNLIYVEAPAHGYSGRIGFEEGGQDYSEFRDTWRTRKPMLYIGGNAGMLHAIEAESGREAWAFVPNNIVRNLSRLTTPQFNFVPTVNGSPAVADAYFGGSWRTMLIGSLGLGGQAIFAIDVTDPDDPKPSWEFSDRHAQRLGYTYGQPRITRLQDGRWVVLVAGGYNSESTTDQAIEGLPPLPTPTEPASTVGDGRAALFVLDIATGALIHEFVLPAAANSLAQVTVGEYGTEFKADFAIGGDLNGNLWRFDLSPAHFGTIAHIFQGSPARPITSAPRVFPDPSTGRALFVFGTGKYLEDSDRSISASDPRQAIYGIRERCKPTETTACPTTSPLVEGNLVEQTFQSASDGHIHMNPTGVPFIPSSRDGWFIRLGNPGFFSGALVGERVVDLPLAVFSAGIVVVETYIPSAEACSPLGSRVMYILSAYSGGYALPGGLNDSGTTIVPGSPVFVGQGAATVGKLDDSGQKPQFFIRQDGTLGGPGVPELNFGVTPRRRGWREIPID